MFHQTSTTNDVFVRMKKLQNHVRYNILYDSWWFPDLERHYPGSSCSLHRSLCSALSSTFGPAEGFLDKAEQRNRVIAGLEVCGEWMSGIGIACMCYHQRKHVCVGFRLLHAVNWLTERLSLKRLVQSRLTVARLSETHRSNTRETRLTEARLK